VKDVVRWYSPRLEQELPLVRWGHYGRPVLLFPTAGGDAEECERFLMIDALAQLLHAGRIKVYACESVAGAAWTSKKHSPRYCSRLQNLFDAYVYEEVVPAIRADCRSPDIDIITAGASIGAFNALATICRHPDVFSTAVCMSGTYDVAHWLNGELNLDFYYCSPLHYLPQLGESEQLARLRQRFVILPTGEGRWEDPSQSWRVAEVLGAKGIPNRVDPWGEDFDHDWMTWRAMLPLYLDQLTR
jgi:esterase/lipase superfamily enzyme